MKMPRHNLRARYNAALSSLCKMSPLGEAGRSVHTVPCTVFGTSCDSVIISKQNQNTTKMSDGPGSHLEAPEDSIFRLLAESSSLRL